MKEKAKILHLDIENSPCMSYIWSLWEEPAGYIKVEKDWYIMAIGYGWEGKKEVRCSILPDFKACYENNNENDIMLVKKVWQLLDEADIVVAHNGTRFDIRKINARFIYHGLPPPSPYKIVDTLKEARQHFMFTSNRLGDLGIYFGYGGKKHNEEGFSLWRKCINGDLKAWEKMRKYCKYDVRLLKKIYHRLLPFMNRHPNLGAYDGSQRIQCPKCGSSDVQKRGFVTLTRGRYHQYYCKECGGWSRGTVNLLSAQKRKQMTVGISYGG